MSKILLLITCFLTVLSVRAQQSSPITITEIDGSGFYMHDDKTIVGMLSINNTTDSVITIQYQSPTNDGFTHISILNCDFKEGTRKHNIQIPPHQSLVCRYGSNCYRTIYGEKHGFKKLTDAGVQLNKKNYKPSVTQNFYYKCNKTDKNNTDKKCKYTLEKTIDLSYVRACDKSMKKYFKDTVICPLPVKEDIKVFSTETYGFSYGYNYTGRNDAYSADTFGIEIYGYMRIQNNSSKTINLSALKDFADGDTLVFGLERIWWNPIDSWTLPPSKSVFLSYSRKIKNAEYKNDINAFLVANKEFMGTLVFTAGKEKNEIPIVVPLEIKYFRNY